jgi:hypothetical protein
VSVVLLGWIGWHTDWERVQLAFRDLRVGLWLEAFALLLACQLASAQRWQVLARELHFERSVPRAAVPAGKCCGSGSFFVITAPGSEWTIPPKSEEIKGCADFWGFSSCSCSQRTTGSTYVYG